LSDEALNHSRLAGTVDVFGVPPFRQRKGERMGHGERPFFSNESRNREYFSRNFAFGNRDHNFTGFLLPALLQGP
jgi:hypothetical protein